MVDEIVRWGTEAKIEKIRRLGRKNGEGREVLWARFASVEEKIRAIKGKRNLRDRREWIADDLTEKERSTDWLIRKKADRKRRGCKKESAGWPYKVSGGNFMVMGRS